MKCDLALINELQIKKSFLKIVQNGAQKRGIMHIQQS